jgi:hypothetical protein
MCVCSVAYTHASVHAYDGKRWNAVHGGWNNGSESTLAGLGWRGLGYFFDNQRSEVMGGQVISVGYGIDCATASVDGLEEDGAGEAG